MTACCTRASGLPVTPSLAIGTITPIATSSAIAAVTPIATMGSLSGIATITAIATGTNCSGHSVSAISTFTANPAFVAIITAHSFTALTSSRTL